MKIDSGTSFLDNGRQGRLIGGDESNQECRWTRLEGEPRKSVYRYRYNLVGHRGSTIHGLVEDADTEQVARRLKNVYRQRAGESLGRAISKIGDTTSMTINGAFLSATKRNEMESDRMRNN